MKPAHILMALLVALIWGVNFTVIKVGLGSFPPLLLVALRFVIAALPVLFLPRPAISWGRLIAISATLFVGQFAFLFSGMALGMPAGLASVVLQAQAFITIVIAAVTLREMPARRQIIGILIALAGLVVIAETAGGVDFTIIGLVFCLIAALSWASGNVLLRGTGKVDMLALVSWLSLLPPIPLFLLSLVFEGPQAISHALTTLNWSGIGAVFYIAVLSTTLGFALWSRLLSQYPAATVAPFSLLVPIFGASAAALFLGERFNTLRIAGMVLILAGLIVVVLPWNRILKRPAKSGR